ncbi:hypothetical protein RRV45_13600 [Bacillus sp. DTU_2020_1000418_1_SI_GHA_SEK_038]|uniref:hypothetical protein n=1 Tax=Bacillus sp. DTU_2020_1000418_1_SI_GHA_SEK_038 TaxID=3077585 RepID=UPI0028E9DE6F|nr:hypothetical protein [Bacillus sp. DTU_2020_1000418_1_SI_GHA_SEK_038]WNS73953.1 hypothetical protein RRV45_13600 [Bacillus sp. DTU_2020_1000418_1_SI_GHA_SEK_038]
MYRFSIDKDDWILRFSPHVQIELDIKQIIVSSIVQLGKQLPSFPHGESFIIMNDQIGLIVFNVEKIPSLILTVSNIISKDRWYIQENYTLKPYK